MTDDLYVAPISYKIGQGYWNRYLIDEPFRRLAYRFTGRRYLRVEYDGCMATVRKERDRGKIYSFASQRQLFGPTVADLMGFIVLPDNRDVLTFIPADRLRLVCRSALARIEPLQFADIEFWN